MRNSGPPMPSDGKFVPTFAPPPKKRPTGDSEASGSAVPKPLAATPTPTPAGGSVLDGESSGSIAADTIARLRQAAMERARAKSDRVGQPQSVEELENQVRALEIQLESAHSINTGLQRQLSEINAQGGAEVESLRVRVVAAEARVREVEEENVRLQEIAGEAEALRIELQDATSGGDEVEHLKRENARLDELVRQQDTILAQLQGMAPQMDEMQAELMRLRPLEQDHMATLERVQELETQLRRAMDDLDSAAVKTIEVEGERDALKIQLEDAAKLAASGDASGSATIDDVAVAELRAQLAESQGALEAAYLQLEQANAAIEQANANIDQANAAADYHQAELERTTQALETHYQEEFERMQMEYESTILALQEGGAAAGAPVENDAQLRNEVAALRSQLELADDERRQLRQQVEDYRAVNEQHQLGENEWVDRERAMLEELGELRSRVEHLDEINATLQRNVDSLNEERDAVGRDAEFVLSELERSQHTVSELEARVDAMHLENQQAVSDLEAVRQENEALHAKLEVAQSLGGGAPADGGGGGGGDTTSAQYEAEMEMARQIISNLEQQCEAYEGRISKLQREVADLRAAAPPTRGRQY